MKRKKCKKGFMGIGLVPSLVITLVVIAIMLVVAATTLNGTRQGLGTNGNYAEGTISASGQNFTLPAAAATYNLGHTYLSNFALLNKTGGETIDTGNYTLNQATGIITLKNSPYNGTQVNVTYSYQDGNNSATQILGQGLAANDTMSSWQSTWAIVIASAIVIGIVMLFMSFRKKEEGSVGGGSFSGFGGGSSGSGGGNLYD